jgi:NAD(P)-dependent dehydrogenase (short-subunit alcohol dehydrogenase family)
MSQTFKGKTIAVTGGGSGIGAAICEVLARHGAAVAVLDVKLANARSVAERVGGSAYKVDVTDEKQVAAAYASLEALHGSVNCAGFNHISPIVATKLEDWRKMTAGSSRSGVAMATSSTPGATGSLARRRPTAR